MTITVNSETRDIAPGTSIAALLESLGLNPKVVVVQRNDDIVPRDSHAATLLQEGDIIELVRFVGGG